MSEEEIKKLAAELGLDPERLVLREPFQRDFGFGKVKQFCFEYHKDNRIHKYTFVLTEEDIVLGPETAMVELYVNKGLRELARTIKKTDLNTGKVLWEKEADEVNREG